MEPRKAGADGRGEAMRCREVCRLNVAGREVKDGSRLGSRSRVQSRSTDFSYLITAPSCKDTC